jgi:tyrosyl-tRNA synthetase
VAHELPEDVPVVDWEESGSSIHLPALLQHTFGISTSEARRALSQGGVKIDGEPVANGSLDLAVDEVAGKVLQLGKRRFARVHVK